MTVPPDVLDVLFREARTHNGWRSEAVSPETLRALHDLVKWGPTSANCSPQRVVFITSAEAKAQLKPFLSPGNVDKTMTAPVTALLAYDMAFYEHLPQLFPHADARSWFAGKPEAHIRDTAFRSATLQAGYFIIAARALGLDCGPMSGFDAPGVEAAFLADTTYKANMLVNLGHGDPAKLFPRSPRFAFDDVCRIA